MQIYQSYFAAIGVTMDINVVDLVSFNRLQTDHKYDQGICTMPIGKYLRRIGSLPLTNQEQ